MKVVVLKAALAEMIGKIQGVVSLKPSIPILAHILFEARENKIRIAATDLNVSMEAEIEAKVSEPGALTLPARKFFHLVRELTSTSLQITATEDIATVQAGDSHFRLHAMSKSAFPTIPHLAQAKSVKLPANVLKQMLCDSTFAAAKDDTRQVLNGVLMRLLGNQATFIGTDGKRLAKLTTQIENGEQLDHDYVIPSKAVDEMIKLLDGDNGVVIKVLPDKIGLEMPSIFLVTQLIAGDFPNVDRIIPQKTPLAIEVHREELMTLLRQIALFTPDKGHSVQFSFQKGELLLNAANRDVGEGKVSMPIDYSGEPLEIAFNPHFFHEILRHCQKETVCLSLTDPYNPGLITDAADTKFVIMPMRLKSSPTQET